MNQLIDNILAEWSYRVHNGMPNPKNNEHLVVLEQTLMEMGLPKDFASKLLQNLREEDWWSKLTPDEQSKYIKDHPQSQKAKDAKEKDGGDEEEFDVGGPAHPNVSKNKKTSTEESKDYLQDLDIEIPEGLSDEEIQSIAQTEKERREFISKTIDLMMSQVTQQRKGAGTNDLTQEEWKQLKDFTEGNGPKNPTYDITEDDIDDAIEQIRSFEGGGKVISALGNKGAAGLGSDATTRKWVTNPNYDPNKPAGKRGAPSSENPKVLPGPGQGREKKVIQSFLMTGGLSVVTGKPLSIGLAELDHRLSLDNGGKDEASNWVWMESRFNQQKNKLSDEQLIKRANKWLSMDPEKLKADKKKKLITNESNAYAAQHWKGIFEKGGNGGINQEMLNNLTIPTIKNIIKGWNKVNPDMVIQYYQAGDGNRDRGVFVGKGEMVRRAIETMNKKEKVMTTAEIEEANKVLENALDEIKNRERDIKV